MELTLHPKPCCAGLDGEGRLLRRCVIDCGGGLPLMTQPAAVELARQLAAPMSESAQLRLLLRVRAALLQVGYVRIT